MTTAPRRLRPRPSEEAVTAALPTILAAAAGATHLTAGEVLACATRGRHGRLADKRAAAAVRVAVAEALVSRSVRVRDAVRHAGVGTTAYHEGVPADFAAVARAARRAAEFALPCDDSQQARTARATMVIEDVAGRRGMAVSTLLERHTVAAREARAEVVLTLREEMSIPQVAAAIGFTRLTCYRLAKGGYHTRADRRSPMNRTAAPEQVTTA